MIKVKYCEHGEPISDFKVDEYVDSIIKCHESDFEIIVATASELCLMVFGLRVFEEKIPIDEIEFYFEDKKLDFHPHLGIYDPDNHEIGFFTQTCEKALRLGFQKMKADKSVI